MRRSQLDWRTVLQDDDEDIPKRNTTKTKKEKSRSTWKSNLATAAQAVAIPLGVGLAAYAAKSALNEHGFTGADLRRWFLPGGDALDAHRAENGGPMQADVLADAAVTAPIMDAPPTDVGGAPAPSVFGGIEPTTLGQNNMIVPIGGNLQQQDYSGVPAQIVTQMQARLNYLEGAFGVLAAENQQRAAETQYLDYATQATHAAGEAAYDKTIEVVDNLERRQVEQADQTLAIIQRLQPRRQGPGHLLAIAPPAPEPRDVYKRGAPRPAADVSRPTKMSRTHFENSGH